MFVGQYVGVQVPKARVRSQNSQKGPALMGTDSTAKITMITWSPCMLITKDTPSLFYKSRH